ncbi:hypothetical protein M707_16675 [Arthrobacter sp. AK-YN10]|nr:hypothetical protein M707_16675 [Arthrobacter sp. AK-YN10]
MSAEPVPNAAGSVGTAGGRRYKEPTSQQVEDAAALMFLAATRKALRDQQHIWDVQLELEVTCTVHNQRRYCVHASTRTGESITGTSGVLVHPANGTAESAAWSIAESARTASAKRRQKSAIKVA